MLASPYMSKLNLNISNIREYLWSIKVQDSGDVDHTGWWIDWRVKDYNLCIGQLPIDTDATNTDSAKTITKMSEQEHIFYLLSGIPRNNKWKVFFGLMMDKNTTMTAMPKEIVTKLIEKKAGIKTETGLTPEAPLVARRVVMVVVMATKQEKMEKTKEG
jgi:hypothetical protein